MIDRVAEGSGVGARRTGTRLSLPDPYMDVSARNRRRTSLIGSERAEARDPERNARQAREQVPEQDPERVQQALFQQPTGVRGRAEAGFTLIEIMVVVVILGILGALIVPNVISRPDDARVQRASADVRAIANALELYRMDNGNYPSTDQGLDALVSEPSGYPEARRWNPEGYLGKMPMDPWDEPYLYYNEGRSYDVYTFGADRKEGGESYDADIRYSDL